MTAALAAGLRAFVEELVRAGLREAVVCPGSRSTMTWRFVSVARSINGIE